MADHEDEMAGYLAHTLFRAFMAIGMACETLPLPIRFPDDGNPANARQAVARAAELVTEQPIPLDMQAALHAACVHWVAAADLLLVLLGNDYEEIRAEGVMGNLLYTYDVLRLFTERNAE
ncbi:hypothetical protein ACFWPV_09955 [Streptomyces uncialis]|uniref:hypothetical protein n=1 Tax=Streptomyces uncialis TaxID=1048205 RepID=UPI00364B03A0